MTNYESTVEDKLYQQHITYCASGDRQQHLSFPTVKSDDKQDGDQFRYSVIACENAGVFQTVDD